MGIPPAGYKPYPGGHFLSYDKSTGKLENLALNPNQDGIISATMDPTRGRLYGLTWPSGHFLRYDVAKKELRDLGPIPGQLPNVPVYRALCRAPVVNQADGSVLFTTVDGLILRYVHDRDAMEIIQGEDMNTERIMRVAGTSVSYKLVLPDGYDAAKTYPAVLVMGGGPQTMNTVEGTLERSFRVEAERRGYIVVAPAAPDGELFFQGAERIYPEFLDMVLASHKIEGGRFHVAGPSNGGIAAMHVAALHPKYFFSATAFPGYLWRATEAKLRDLADVCVFLYVGENDEYRWHEEMEREAEFLAAIGTKARYSLERLFSSAGLMGLKRTLLPSLRVGVTSQRSGYWAAAAGRTSRSS